jgi:hypothetical protein
MKTIYDLKLHERAWFADLEGLQTDWSLDGRHWDDSRCWVMRVASGWVYNFDGDKVFVPFSDGFQHKVKPKPTPVPTDQRR